MINSELVMDLRAEIRKIAMEEVKKAIEEQTEPKGSIPEQPFGTDTNVGGNPIDRQAAIEALRTCYDTKTISMDNGDEYINYGDAVGEIEQLPTAQPRWIPCGERLPEDDVEVLVTDDAGGVQWLGVDKMMSYEDGSGRFWLISQHPSAWMPLPEPYKGEP